MPTVNQKSSHTRNRMMSSFYCAHDRNNSVHIPISRYNIFYILSALIILSTTYAKEVIWMETLDREISRSIKPHQLIIFAKFNSKNDEFHKSIESTPKIVADISNISQQEKENLLSLPTFINPRSSSLFVMIENESDNEFLVSKISRFIEFVNATSRILQKPRCLIILSKNSSFSDENCERSLYQAWQNKLLDFSIMKIVDHRNAILYLYNPFSNKYSNMILEEKTRVFPDKLIDMHQYPFKLLLYHQPPLMNIIRKNGDLEINGMLYLFIDIFCRKINCKLYNVRNSSRFESIDVIYRLLSNNTVNAHIIAHNVGSILFTKPFPYSRTFGNSKIAFIVPALKSWQVNVPPDILIFFPLVSLFLLLFLAVSHYLKFSRINWNALRIFENLVGVSVRRVPIKSSERVIFLLITFISFSYSSDIFSEFTKAFSVYQYVNLDTFKQLAESNLKLEYPSYFEEALRHYEDVSMKQLMSRGSKTSKVTDCIERLKVTQGRICAGPLQILSYLIRTHRNSDGLPFMKLSKATLYDDFVAFPFERSSPYIEKFNQILRIILESGLPKSPYYTIGKGKNYLNSEGDNATDVKQKNIITVLLLFVLLIGFSLAIFVFIVELFVGKRDRTLVQKIRWNRAQKLMLYEFTL